MEGKGRKGKFEKETGKREKGKRQGTTRYHSLALDRWKGMAVNGKRNRKGGRESKRVNTWKGNSK